MDPTHSYETIGDELFVVRVVKDLARECGMRFECAECGCEDEHADWCPVAWAGMPTMLDN